MRLAFSSGLAELREPRAQRAPVALDPAAAAWLAVVPVAAITIVAIVLLGPTAGSVLLSTPSGHLLSGPQSFVQPEPTEQARYLIALAAPLLLAASTLLLARRAPRWVVNSAATLAGASELLSVLVVAGCFVAQRYQAPQAKGARMPPVVYFTLATVIVAAALAVAICVGVRSPRVRARAAGWLRESRARRIGCALVALVALAVALLPAINTDSSLASEFEAVIYHLQFTYDESMAVLAGRSPLGDFATQYSSLWPYLLAGGMSLLGPSVGVFTGLMATLSGVTLLALYDVLRRLTRSSIGGLLLFLPLLATCQFRLHGPPVTRFSLVVYFGVLPLRYAGPFLLAWLVARHLDGARPRRTWPLFLAAGLAVLNNTDFGIAALGATVAALLWTRERPGAPAARRQLVEAAAGVAGAVALVTVLLLARTGSPPHFSLLFLYARVFVVDGFAMLPIRPLIGFDIVIFLTYVATIGVATVRALRREPDRLLTGLLVWSGIFGLGAGSYYVGHSLSEVLIYTFPAWALSVTLLTLLVVRRLAAAARWPTAGELACLFGFGLLACSLAQTPAPWQQLQRIHVSNPHVFADPIGQVFVAEHTQRGEAVVIMTALGHRIAYNLGLDDVEAFTGGLSVLTNEQADRSLNALRAAGGHSVFVLGVERYEGIETVLQQRGFTLRAQEPQLGMQQWASG